MSGPLLEHLPGIYQPNEQLANFLAPLEALLLGPNGSIRDRILSLPDLLDSQHAPEEFLPWLASWVGLSLRRDLPPERQRALIAHAVPLHMKRGTIYSVKTLLELVTGGQASITEPEIMGLRVGVEATVGSTTRLGRELPHFFQVALDFASRDSQDESWLESLAHETIGLAKPAHTYYSLSLRFSEERGRH
jgi:phage tail-like protein